MGFNDISHFNKDIDTTYSISSLSNDGFLLQAASAQLSQQSFKKLLWESYTNMRSHYASLIKVLLPCDNPIATNELESRIDEIFNTYKTKIIHASFPQYTQDTNQASIENIGKGYVLTPEHWHGENWELPVLGLGDLIGAQTITEYLRIHRITTDYIDYEDINTLDISLKGMKHIDVNNISQLLDEYSGTNTSLSIVPAYVAKILEQQQ